MISFDLPLFLLPPGDERDPDDDSQPEPHPNPRTFTSFCPLIGERFSEPRGDDSLSRGSRSEVPKARGLEDARLPEAVGIFKDALLSLFPLRPADCPADLSPSLMPPLSVIRPTPGCAGDSFLAGTVFRGGDSLSGTFAVPCSELEIGEPVLDRFGRIRSAPGVSICARTWLEGRDVDFWVDAGLPDRSVCGLAERGLENGSPTRLGVPLEADCDGDGAVRTS